MDLQKNGSISLPWGEEFMLKHWTGSFMCHSDAECFIKLHYFIDPSQSYGIVPVSVKIGNLEMDKE